MPDNSVWKYPNKRAIVADSNRSVLYSSKPFKQPSFLVIKSDRSNFAAACSTAIGCIVIPGNSRDDQGAFCRSNMT